MKTLRLLSLVLALGWSAHSARAEPALRAGSTSGTQPARNLFAELLGKSEAELDAKINAAWGHFFQGELENQRLYYPVGPDLAYIADVGSNDVRSEGMSYGMMLAVQLNKRDEFNRLWRWANRHMRHADATGLAVEEDHRHAGAQRQRAHHSAAIDR